MRRWQSSSTPIGSLKSASGLLLSWISTVNLQKRRGNVNDTRIPILPSRRAGYVGSFPQLHTVAALPDSLRAVASRPVSLRGTKPTELGGLVTGNERLSVAIALRMTKPPETGGLVMRRDSAEFVCRPTSRSNDPECLPSSLRISTIQTAASCSAVSATSRLQMTVRAWCQRRSDPASRSDQPPARWAW